MNSYQTRSIVALSASEFSWAMLLVASHLAIARYALEPFLFSTIQLFSGGLVLILLSRHPLDWRDFLLDYHTILYGVARVGTGAFFTAALVHIAASSAAMLGIFNVTIGMTLLFMLHRKLPSMAELPGHGLILGGFLTLCWQLEDGFSNPAILFMLASEVCVVISSIVAERHPRNQGDNPGQRAYLTGVLLTTSGFLTVLGALAINFISLALVGDSGFTDVGAALSAVFQPDVWIFGALIGVLLRGPVVYFSLRAVQLAGAQSYLAFSALLPFLSLGLEHLLSASGHQLASITRPEQVATGLIMTLGSLWVLANQQNWPVVHRLVGRTAPVAKGDDD